MMNNRLVKAWLALALIGAVASAGIGGAVFMRQSAVSGSDTAVVRIGSDLSVPSGGSTTVPLEVLNAPAPGVGAATVDIVYDPAVVHPTGWSPGPAFDMVNCNLNYATNKVRCTAIDAQGVSGNSLLANITFDLVGNQGQCSPLDVQTATFTDPNGDPMPLSSQSGQVCMSTSLTPVSPSPVQPSPESLPTPTLLPPPDSSPTAPATVPTSPTGVGSVQLVRGCNPVVSTWPDETEPLIVASSTDPSSAVAAIWKFDQERTLWLGFSPTAPAHVSDLDSIQYLDVIFLCVGSDALLTRPEA